MAESLTQDFCAGVLVQSGGAESETALPYVVSGRGDICGIPKRGSDRLVKMGGASCYTMLGVCRSSEALIINKPSPGKHLFQVYRGGSQSGAC